MSFSENTNGNGMVMPVAPMNGNGAGYGGGFGWGDGSFWIIVLFIFALMGNWGGNGFAAAEASANARQIADMQQNFAAQTANTTGLNAIASNLANCCCENRAATADLKYTVATEACADRAAVNDALQAVVAQNNANTQRILDQMCSDKIDAKNEKIAELQNQLTLANLAASQNAQTAQILTDNLAQTQALEQYLAPVPRPAYIVQNPSCCNTGFNTCGCMA